MAHIQVIQHEEASGRLKDIYDNLIKTRGKLAEVHKIQSLNPETIVNHMDLYMTIMFGQSPLKRVQREMIAVVVSVANGCNYCQTHHAEAVNHYWKNDAKIEQLRTDFENLDLPEKDKLLCRYADTLTKNPGNFESNNEYTQSLKNAGFSDREILDATLVIAYFNFVNRIVLGLGVFLEDDGGGGYKYE